MTVSGGYGSDDDGLAGMGAGVRGVADDLRRTGAELRQATEAATDLRSEAESPDGLVQVTVDGRPRLVALRLHPRMLDTDPDTLDLVLTTTINEALTRARTTARAALFDNLSPGVRSAMESLIDDGGQEADRW